MKRITNVLVLLIMVALSSTVLWGQAGTLTNCDQGTVTNHGKIVFKQDAAKFTNNGAGTVTNSGGTFQFTGNVTTAVFDGTGTKVLGTFGNRIGGTVQYTGTGTTTVSGNGGATYYDSLIVDGTSIAITIPDGVHVFGKDDGYKVGSGFRTYTSTFYYDGTGSQNIASEAASSGATNKYNDLNFSPGLGLNAVIVA